MTQRISSFLFHILSTTHGLLAETLRCVQVTFHSRASLIAENLFLRKQLAFYRERNITPQRLTDSARLTLLFWARWFNWRNALVVVQPETFIGWHRWAFQRFWRWKSRGGRPQLPKGLSALIAEMVLENPTWGEARVSSELAFKLGIFVSPRSVRAYWPEDRNPNRGPSSQRWMTFVRNHAQAIVACDFVVAVTLRFRIIYVFVVMEVGSRKLIHVNATPHPTSLWTLQQPREAIPSDHGYRWMIHDRSGIFSEDLNHSVETLGIEVLKAPIRAPKANAYCERLIGSLRRECLDWFIPLNERHLRTLAREWAVHYNQGRSHKSLGPGIPDPRPGLPVKRQIHRHEVPEGFVIKKKSILSGLHHEYRLHRVAA
jgi:putative transposase